MRSLEQHASCFRISAKQLVTLGTLRQECEAACDCIHGVGAGAWRRVSWSRFQGMLHTPSPTPKNRTQQSWPRTKQSGTATVRSGMCECVRAFGEEQAGRYRLRRVQPLSLGLRRRG
eukprot:450674-Rhodomonas_salina.1